MKKLETIVAVAITLFVFIGLVAVFSNLIENGSKML